MVKSTTAFGAFIEIMPGTEGLLHISEMRHGRTEKTEDVVKKGDRVKVKLLERDERGRLRLSMKALQPKPEGPSEDDNGAGGRGGRDRADRPAREDGAPDLGEQSESGRAYAAEGASEGGSGDRPRRPRRGGGGGRGGSGRSRE